MAVVLVAAVAVVVVVVDVVVAAVSCGLGLSEKGVRTANERERESWGVRRGKRQTVKRGEIEEKSRESSAMRPQREQRVGCQLVRYAWRHSPFGVTLGCSGLTNMLGLGRTKASGASSG